MFRDLINKGRDFADKLTNMVMNYTEAETKVREATSDEPWGPHGQLMMQIADLTFSHGTYLEVMCTLWNRLHVDASRGWRRTYKSLVLLEFLLKNGSDQVAPGARENIYDLRGLESFHFIDENGKDQGINVRIKVQEIIDLLQDPERLEAERSKAKVNSRIYFGRYASDRMESNTSSSHPNRVTRHWRSSSRDTYDDDDDDEVDRNRDRWTRLSSPQSAHQPNRLGSFDDWHLGRERGIVDEVVDHMREAWDVAKITTRDLFIQRDSDVHPNESNPRMVSEELYQFPDCAVEVDGAFMQNSRDPSPEEFELPEPVHQEERPKSVPQKNHRGAPPPSSKLQATKLESRPQVPQASLIQSFDVCASNNADLLNLDDPLDSSSVWPTGNGPTLPSVLSPPSLSLGAGLGPHKSTSVSVESNGGVLDADFGDFVSADGQMARPTASASLGLIDFSSVPPVPSATPSDATWPGVAATSSNSQAPVSSIARNAGPSVANLSSPAVEPNPKARTNPVIGSTWKELDSLGINLDTLAMPSKVNSRQTTGPSLRQLQYAGKPDSPGASPFFSAYQTGQQSVPNHWQSAFCQSCSAGSPLNQNQASSPCKASPHLDTIIRVLATTPVVNLPDGCCTLVVTSGVLSEVALIALSDKQLSIQQPNYTRMLLLLVNYFLRFTSIFRMSSSLSNFRLNPNVDCDVLLTTLFCAPCLIYVVSFRIWIT
ncbi:unnamed protein product [Dicrocoelium dendriticum]|nr:unnamed protein product [Dicrocoelium dendriticum]